MPAQKLSKSIPLRARSEAAKAMRARSWKNAQERKKQNIAEAKERRAESVAWQEENGKKVRPSLWNYRARERERIPVKIKARLEKEREHGE